MSMDGQGKQDLNTENRRALGQVARRLANVNFRRRHPVALIQCLSLLVGDSFCNCQLLALAPAMPPTTGAFDCFTRAG